MTQPILEHDSVAFQAARNLDIFEIINEIEDEFDVKIDTDESIETVSDLVTFITEKAEA